MIFGKCTADFVFCHVVIIAHTGFFINANSEGPKMWSSFGLIPSFPHGSHRFHIFKRLQRLRPSFIFITDTTYSQVNNPELVLSAVYDIDRVF